ncbi:MAG: hypothetical protein AAB355_02355 [Patescibacteria group bacterium]
MNIKTQGKTAKYRPLRQEHRVITSLYWLLGSEILKVTSVFLSLYVANKYCPDKKRRYLKRQIKDVI